MGSSRSSLAGGRCPACRRQSVGFLDGTVDLCLRRERAYVAASAPAGGQSRGASGPGGHGVKNWSRRSESNRGPHHYECYSALFAGVFCTTCHACSPRLVTLHNGPFLADFGSKETACRPPHCGSRRWRCSASETEQDARGPRLRLGSAFLPSCPGPHCVLQPAALPTAGDEGLEAVFAEERRDHHQEGAATRMRRRPSGDAR